MMDMNRLDKFLAAALLAGTTMATQAAEISFSGFASFGAGKVLDENEFFPEVDLTGKNSFYDNETKFKPDSTYALQAIADMGEGISLTAQIVGKGARDFDAELEWAYVTYKPSDNWSFSAGRKRVPLYYYSDFLDVGYAYHWIRTPVQVYKNELTSYEGVQGTFSFFMGDWENNITYYYGSANPNGESNDVLGQQDTELNYDELTGLVLETGYDWIRLRATYAQANFTYKTVIPEVGQEKLTFIDDEFVNFMGVAVFLTPGNWTLGAEYTEFEFDDNVNGEENWYATLGYRIGSVMPHITYSETNNKDEIFDGQDIENITVGLRWDFHPSTALKFEYSENKISDTGFGIYADAELLAISIDLLY